MTTISADSEWLYVVSYFGNTTTIERINIPNPQAPEKLVVYSDYSVPFKAWLIVQGITPLASQTSLVRYDVGNLYAVRADGSEVIQLTAYPRDVWVAFRGWWVEEVAAWQDVWVVWVGMGLVLCGILFSTMQVWRRNTR